MRVVRTKASTLMGLLVGMKRFRMAATPTISSKAICTIRTKATAMTTAPSPWLDEEILRVGCLPTLVFRRVQLSQVGLNDVSAAALGVSPLLAMLIIVVVFVYKSISDLDRLLEKLSENDTGFDDDGEFEDEEWQ
jgi:hypothetical protein